VLPPNFAEQVLEYEMQVEQGRFTIKVVDQLIYLYSQAIEYYESID